MQRRATACLLAVAAAYVLLIASSPAVAQDIGTYRAAIEQAAESLRGPSPDPEAAAVLLESVQPVAIDGAPPVQPNFSPIISDLRATPPNVERALVRLEALIASVERLSLSPAGDGAALSTLDAVLARGEFAPPDPDDGAPTLRERLSNWIGERVGPVVETLAEWLEPVFGSGGGARAGEVVIRAILAAIGIASVIAVIVLVIRNIRGSMSSDVARLEAERELKMTSAEARADAERLFQDGNFREALRLMYLSTLLRLDEAGRLRFDRSLTNLEVLSATQLHGDQTLRQRLAPLVDRFDRVWYGGAPCSADDYRTFSRLADQVWEGQP